jgi:hypothetical protein
VARSGYVNVNERINKACKRSTTKHAEKAKPFENALLAINYANNERKNST